MIALISSPLGFTVQLDPAAGLLGHAGDRVLARLTRCIGRRIHNQIIRTGDTLNRIAYRHLLVVYDGTSEGDEAVVAADLLAQRDQARLTIVVVVELERAPLPATRLPRGTSVWNDVLLDHARADLERAGRLVESPAEFTVLFGPAARAVPDGAREFGCDAIMLPPPPRGRLKRLFSRDAAGMMRRRTSCEVLQPR